MDAMYDKLVAQSPGAVVLLIAMYFFLRQINTMSERHKKCLGERDKTIRAVTTKLMSGLKKNTSALERNSLAIERLDPSAIHKSRK